jgi:Ca2+-binding RTX toxin-like protein
VSVEDVHLYSSKTGGGGPNSVDTREISGATKITVHGPADPTGEGYLAADLTLTQLAAGLPLGIAGFAANLDAQLANSAGSDLFSFTVDGFTGSLTTFGVETLSFTLALTGEMANDFDLTNTSGVTTYTFGGTGAAEVAGLPIGATLEFAGYSGNFVLDNTAGATPTARISGSNVDLDSTNTLSSLLITTGTHNGASGGAIDLRAVQFDPGVTVQIDADANFNNLGFLDVYTSTDADASASSVPVNLFGSGGTGLTLIGSPRGGELLVGGFGADRLDGGGGYVDRYIGNVGSDTFVFRFPPNNAGAANGAFLQDFQPGVDKIELNQSLGAFTSVVDDGLGGLDPGDFLQVDSVDLANPGGQHVIYEPGTGNLYYDADGAGGNAPEIFALIAGDRPGPRPQIDADDFVIV